MFVCLFFPDCVPNFKFIFFKFALTLSSFRSGNTERILEIENIDSSDQAIIQFVSFNESELSSIISLIDQTAVDRGDTAFANYTPQFKSTNEIIDQLSKYTNDTSLSDYLASVDETISKRN